MEELASALGAVKRYRKAPLRCFVFLKDAMHIDAAHCMQLGHEDGNAVLQKV
jgi:hypothetical protein